jgi:two-component system sensor histidine kinase GlrK
LCQPRFRKASRVHLYYPSSFLKLILAAFALVTLPLILSTTHGTVSVNRISDQSEDAVRRAVVATQSSWMLVQRLTAMERVARQFVVLGEAGLLEDYRKSREQFLTTTTELSGLSLEPQQRSQLQQLVAREQAIFETLRRYADDDEAARRAVADFARLSELAQAILSGSGQVINLEMTALQRTAANTRRSLVLESLSVIPIALLLAGGFALIIARPIRQIDGAIHRLGRGEFEGPVSVSGPKDLQNLGGRLEWLRNRLLDLEAQRSRLLQHVSHELKTPLAALREGTQLLADGVVGSPTPQQAEVLQILRQSTLQLQKRIENLLDFKLSQSQDAPSPQQPVDLAQVLAKNLRGHQIAIMRKALTVEVDAKPVEVMGADSGLTAIVDNLLSNAIKYSPAGESIRIRLRRDGLLAVLDVIDAGPGIGADEREDVFEAFFQGRAAREGNVPGTGLGLSIAREHVLAHGGSIEVVPRTEPGAHLRVILPACQQEEVHA